MHSGGARTRCFVGAERIRVQIACAAAGRQTVLNLELQAGCTAAEALLRSGVFALHPDIDASGCRIGIFGQEVTRDHCLQDGDRVEVLRPLMEDPRERRRRLAKQGSGKKSAGDG
ncbi:MAG: RnfH family protein [Gammaproteobacteria bacterium]|nr:RnfH family protein [Gammaproteobacteria bacterium]